MFLSSLLAALPALAAAEKMAFDDRIMEWTRQSAEANGVNTSEVSINMLTQDDPARTTWRSDPAYADASAMVSLMEASRGGVSLASRAHEARNGPIIAGVLAVTWYIGYKSEDDFKKVAQKCTGEFKYRSVNGANCIIAWVAAFARAITSGFAAYAGTGATQEVTRLCTGGQMSGDAWTGCKGGQEDTPLEPKERKKRDECGLQWQDLTKYESEAYFQFTDGTGMKVTITDDGCGYGWDWSHPDGLDLLNDGFNSCILQNGLQCYGYLFNRGTGEAFAMARLELLPKPVGWCPGNINGQACYY